jgi:hypothetical protein
MLGVALDFLDPSGKARATRSEVIRTPDAIDAALQLPLLYRTDGAVRLVGRLAIPAASLDTAKFDVGVRVGNKSVSAAAVRPAAGGGFHVALPVAHLAPGRYAVEARLVVPGLTDEPVVSQFPFELMAGPTESQGGK